MGRPRAASPAGRAASPAPRALSPAGTMPRLRVKAKKEDKEDGVLSVVRARRLLPRDCADAPHSAVESDSVNTPPHRCSHRHVHLLLLRVRAGGERARGGACDGASAAPIVALSRPPFCFLAQRPPRTGESPPLLFGGSLERSGPAVGSRGTPAVSRHEVTCAATARGRVDTRWAQFLGESLWPCVAPGDPAREKGPALPHLLLTVPAPARAGLHRHRLQRARHLFPRHHPSSPEVHGASRAR